MHALDLQNEPRQSHMTFHLISIEMFVVTYHEMFGNDINDKCLILKMNVKVKKEKNWTSAIRISDPILVILLILASRQHTLVHNWTYTRTHTNGERQLNNASHELYTSSPSNSTVVNVVLGDLNLHFQGQTFYYCAFVIKMHRRRMSPCIFASALELIF